MKIVFLLDDFPPVNYSSASMIADDLAKEFLSRGHEVFVISTVQNRIQEKFEIRQNIKIYRIFSNYNQRLRFWLEIFNPQTVFKVKKILKEIKPDICHFHHIHKYLSYCCFKIAKRHSKAVFLTAHDVDLVHCGKLMPRNDSYIYKISAWDEIKELKKRYNPFRKKLIHYYLEYVDKIFAVSGALKRVLEINKIKNIEIIHNGTDVDDWQVNSNKLTEFKNKYNLQNKKVLIFVARLIEAKGGDQLIESLSLVNQKFSNFVLLIVGRKWNYTKKLRQLANDFGIKEKIVFTDFLEKNELKSAYYSSDISVLPSLCFESFGMTNLEAMACKKPVVSSYFGGPSEVVIDGKTGYLLNPNNIELMAEKIIDLLKNPQKAEQFGKEGYNRAKNLFPLLRQTEQILNWYRKFIGD